MSSNTRSRRSDSELAWRLFAETIDPNLNRQQLGVCPYRDSLEITLKLTPYLIYCLPAPLSCSARTRFFNDINHESSLLIVGALSFEGTTWSVTALL